MKLEMDCVRDILLCVEQNTGLRSRCFFVDESSAKNLANLLGSSVDIPEYQPELTQKYGNDVLIYHVRYCIEAGLLRADERAQNAIQNCVLISDWEIIDLTVKGHDLIASIRNEDRWTGIKRALPVIRNYSLDAISAVSQGMTSGAISAFLEKNH